MDSGHSDGDDRIFERRSQREDGPDRRRHGFGWPYAHPTLWPGERHYLGMDEWIRARVVWNWILLEQLLAMLLPWGRTADSGGATCHADPCIFGPKRHSPGGALTKSTTLPRRAFLLAALPVLAFGAWVVRDTVSLRSPRPIQIEADGYHLAGSIAEGSRDTATWVIFLHGNRAGGQDHSLYRRLVGNLREDVSVLALDMRGFGASLTDGLTEDDPILDRTGDIEAAVAHLSTAYGVTPSNIILMGHSLGALQVLRAGQDQAYSLVVAIGPGDMRTFLDDPSEMQAYAAKFRANMGASVSAERIAAEGARFTPQRLFSPCPRSPTVLVFGQFDLAQSLRGALDEVPNACREVLDVVTVPFADHMYWTELGFVPDASRWYVSWPSVALLTMTVNGLLVTAPPG
ncbi:MAG TPA: alpha/beta fold hydrolase [Anaerolineales bacterium]